MTTEFRRLHQRKGTTAQWTSANPILASGEIGYDTNTKKFKIGDGITNWLTLANAADVNLAFGTTSGTVTQGNDVRLSDARTPLSHSHTFTPPEAYGMLASDNGITGTGLVDESSVLQTFLNNAAAAGVMAILDPQSTILVDATINIPGGTHLNMNQATIKRKSTASATSMLLLQNVSNVIIENGILHGDKVGYNPVTEWRHGIGILGSDNVTLKDLRSTMNKGDGVYVGEGASGSNDPCRNINLNNVVCDDNHRQGLSIVTVDGFTAQGCRFSNTGVTPSNGVYGVAPCSGVDIEPNPIGGGVVDQLCRNITFVGCAMDHNKAIGVDVTLQTGRNQLVTGNITFTGCTMDYNGNIGILLTEAEDVSFIGCSASDNVNSGVFQYSLVARIAKNIKFSDMTISRNGKHGVELATSWTDITFTNCIIENNGTNASNTYDGINAEPTLGSSFLKIIGCIIDGTAHKYGLRTGANVLGVTSIGNTYWNSVTAPTFFADNLTYRVVLDSDNGLSLPAGADVYLGQSNSLVQSTSNIVKKASSGANYYQMQQYLTDLVTSSSADTVFYQNGVEVNRISMLPSGIITIEAAIERVGKPWVAATLTNSWVNYGTQQIAGYREMADGTTMLRGLIKNGTPTECFVLPASARPLKDEFFFVAAGTGGSARVDVLSTGVVKVGVYTAPGANTLLSLSGIRFSNTT